MSLNKELINTIENQSNAISLLCKRVSALEKELDAKKDLVPQSHINMIANAMGCGYTVEEIVSKIREMNEKNTKE